MMNKNCRTLENFISKFDLFSSNQFLRLGGEAEFKSTTGGIASLFVIIFLVATFRSRILGVSNKETISSTTNINLSNHPKTLNLTANNDTNLPFMIGVQIWKFNLSDGPRMFDIHVKNKLFDYGIQNQTFTKEQSFTLEPCSEAHWAGLPEAVGQINITSWLCLPLNFNFTIQGKYSSPIQRTLEFSVNKCNDATDSSRPCAASEIIDEFVSQPQFFTIYFINNLVNPGNSSNPVQTYLQDRNYIIFGKTSGSEGILYVEDFEMSSDENVWWWSGYEKTATGFQFQRNHIKNPYPNNHNGTQYCMFSLFRSQRSIIITREFAKYFDLISFIGGLFGSIFVLLTICKIYNQFLFEFVIGSKILSQRNTQNKLSDYNPGYFLFHLLLIAFKKLSKKCVFSQKLEKFNESRQQIQRQIDIGYLVKRINHLQKCTEVLFDENQLNLIMMIDDLTLEEAEDKRKRFARNKMFKKYYQDKDNNDPAIINHAEAHGSTDETCQAELPYIVQHEIQKLEKQNNRINEKILKLIQPIKDIIKKLNQQSEKRNQIQSSQNDMNSNIQKSQSSQVILDPSHIDSGDIQFNIPNLSNQEGGPLEQQ